MGEPLKLNLAMQDRLKFSGRAQLPLGGCSSKRLCIRWCLSWRFIVLSNLLTPVTVACTTSIVATGGMSGGWHKDSVFEYDLGPSTQPTLSAYPGARHTCRSDIPPVATLTPHKRNRRIKFNARSLQYRNSYSGIPDVVSFQYHASQPIICSTCGKIPLRILGYASFL